jgi:hypothetical protein
VRIGDDGGFTLPLIPQGGGYEVRVSAPGYLSASQNLHEHVQGMREGPLPKPPAQFCMARFGKPDCELTLPDGNFLLTPTAVEVQQMSEAAQDGFGLPKENFLKMPAMRAAALSADGNRLALLTVIPHTVEHMADPAVCVGWIYDFRADRLSRIEPQLPTKYCEGATTSLDWKGDTVLLRFDETIFGTQKIETSCETMRWLGDAAQTASVGRLPGLIDHEPKGFAAKDNELAMDKTDDERFAVVIVSEDCRQCDTTMVMTSDHSWQLRLNALLGSFGTIPGYWLDRAKDRLILIGADDQGEKQIGVKIVDLLSHESGFIHCRRSADAPRWWPRVFSTMAGPASPTRRRAHATHFPRIHLSSCRPIWADRRTTSRFAWQRCLPRARLPTRLGADPNCHATLVTKHKLEKRPGIG